MSPDPAPPLVADDPAAWLERHRSTYFRDVPPSVREVALGDLLDGGGGLLRARFEGELREGWAPQPGVTGVVGAFAGAVAGFVGYAAIASGAHWLVGPGGVRWVLDDDGWPAAVTLLDHRVLVAPGHPWAGLAGVEVEADPDARARRCIDGLVAALTPIVEQARACTKVGRAGLWNSVVDSIGHAAMYQSTFPADHAQVDVVRRLLAVPGAPWRARPDVRGVDTELGTVCVAQRGGCCLVYTQTWPDEHDDHEHDELHARFYEAFTDPPDAPGYCNDCSLRPEEDCFARLLWWRTTELELRREGAAP